MRTRVAALALLATMFSAAPAQASTQFTFLNGGSVIAFGFYVGPYSGTQGTGPSAKGVTLNCVDFFHEVVNGQTWFANISSLTTGNGVGTNTVARRFDPASQRAPPPACVASSPCAAEEIRCPKT